MTERLLLATPVPPLLVSALSAYDLVSVPPAGDPARLARIAEVGAGIRGAVSTSAGGLSAEEIALLPDLEVISSFGAGLDGLDVAAAHARSIVVANTPDVLTDAVADLAVGLLIDVVRGISASDRFVRSGRWAAGEFFPLTAQVTGRRVGVVGLGRIGRAVAHRLEAFGCEIAYHNRHRAEVSYPWFGSVSELATWADTLIVAAPGGAVLVGAAELAALGATGVLVNVGRGSCVDEEALVDALLDGVIAGAGLDVFVDEPHVSEELLALDNVVVVSHIGSATTATRQAMADQTVANLDEWFSSGRVLSPVT